MKKIKVLVVSAKGWNTNNVLGNSYSNIFSGLDENIEIANLYNASGVVNDTMVKYAYRTTEKELAMSILKRNQKVGSQVKIENTTGTGENLTDSEKKFLRFAKLLRWKVLYWGREILWRLGKWNNDNFKKFIKDFQPDIIFVPIYGNVYMNRVQLAVKKIADVPMLGYISDDNYTLKKFSLSPLFWIDRLNFRRYVKKVVDASEILYVISQVQKDDYDRIFNKDCRILTKGFDFLEMPSYAAPEKPYQLFYAGNIGDGRWKSLAKIGKAIEQINQNGQQMELIIYTPTPLTAKMEKALNIPGCTKTAGRIPYVEVVRKQRQADILVHVEPTDLTNRFSAYHGFSTKLVDYMGVAKPIFAYGLEMQASIAHLKKYDAAIVSSTEEELLKNLQKLCDNPQLLQEYGRKAWECGKENHNIKKFQKMLMDDFAEVLKH